MMTHRYSHWIDVCLLTLSCILLMSCNSPSNHVSQPADAPDLFGKARTNMVNRQLAGRDIVNRNVLQAIQKVPRHRFVPDDSQHLAYSDSPLSIGSGQTISQPYIVALMTQLIYPQPTDKVLDVGTGSGYQAAVLAELVNQVYSMEIVPRLATEAEARLTQLGYANVVVRHGDGYHGWLEKAPFDAVIVAAAPDHIPPALVEQLAPGGKLVIPVGEHYQQLIVVEKQADGTTIEQKIAPVAFVPMTGQAQR